MAVGAGGLIPAVEVEAAAESGPAGHSGGAVGGAVRGQRRGLAHVGGVGDWWVKDRKIYGDRFLLFYGEWREYFK